GRQSLGHLYFLRMVNRPGRLVGYRFDETSRGRVAVAAFLDAAEGEMDLGADAGKVDIAHAILAFVAKLAHGTIILRDDRQREAVIGVIVDLHGLVIVLEGNERQMGAKDFFTNRADAMAMMHAVNEGRKKEAAGEVPARNPAAVKQDLGAFLPGE